MHYINAKYQVGPTRLTPQQNAIRWIKQTEAEASYLERHALSRKDVSSFTLENPLEWDIVKSEKAHNGSARVPKACFEEIMTAREKQSQALLQSGVMSGVQAAGMATLPKGFKQSPFVSQLDSYLFKAPALPALPAAAALEQGIERPATAALEQEVELERQKRAAAELEVEKLKAELRETGSCAPAGQPGCNSTKAAASGKPTRPRNASNSARARPTRNSSAGAKAATYRGARKAFAITGPGRVSSRKVGSLILAKGERESAMSGLCKSAR